MGLIKRGYIFNATCSCGSTHTIESKKLVDLHFLSTPHELLVETGDASKTRTSKTSD